MHKAITEYVETKVQEASLVLKVPQVLRALAVLRLTAHKEKLVYPVLKVLTVSPAHRDVPVLRVQTV